MTIPEVAERLREKASQSGDEELALLADQLRRRRRARRAEAASARMTTKLKDDICAFAAQHPEASQATIAAIFLVNQGRVSEALHGKRS